MVIYKRDYLVFSLVITVVLMNIANVIIENHNATKGEELAKIQEEIKTVKRENILINEEILRRSSLPYLQQKAQEQGFREAQQRDYIFLK